MKINHHLDPASSPPLLRHAACLHLLHPSHGQVVINQLVNLGYLMCIEINHSCHGRIVNELMNDGDGHWWWSPHRFGSGTNPDLYLGPVTSIFTILLLHLIMPFLSSVILLYLECSRLSVTIYMYERSVCHTKSSWFHVNHHDSTQQLKAKVKLAVSSLLGLVFAIGVLLLLFSDLGFPYSSKWVHHTHPQKHHMIVKSSS